MSDAARDDEFQDEDDKFIEFVAEDLERGQVNPHILAKLNGRAEEPQADKKKSKKEVFQELIRKSKYEKMVRQKGHAEQSEKVNQLDNLFESLFPELTMQSKGQERKPQTEYERLQANLTFEPNLRPEFKVKEKQEAQKPDLRRKKVEVLQEPAEDAEDQEGSGEEEEEEGEEEEFTDYEESGEDFERDKEGEKVRRFNAAEKSKEDKMHENYTKSLKNLKLLGKMEDDILSKYVNDINDIDLDGEEEELDGEEEGLLEAGEEEEDFDGDEEEDLDGDEEEEEV